MLTDFSVLPETHNGLFAGVSLPPSSRAPFISLEPKIPISFPFERLSVSYWGEEAAYFL